MSWGERSCKRYQSKEPCPYGPTMLTCNHECKHYQWDGKTKNELDRLFEINDPAPIKVIKTCDHRNDKKYLSGNIRKNRRRNQRRKLK